MIILLGFLVGAGIGWLRVGRVGGDRKDHWQWAAAHGFAFALIGLFITVLLDRVM